MRHYETIYIVNPELSDEDTRGVIEKFSGVIEKEKGVIVKVDEWGKQRLAYLVRKFDKGFYVLVDFCGEGDLIKELERELKLDDRILLFQTVKLDDYVDPQDLIQESPEDAPQPEAEEAPAPESAETETENSTTSEKEE
jgi:small subunit ribosomal protein S6